MERMYEGEHKKRKDRIGIGTEGRVGLIEMDEKLRIIRNKVMVSEEYMRGIRRANYFVKQPVMEQKFGERILGNEYEEWVE